MDSEQILFGYTLLCEFVAAADYLLCHTDVSVIPEINESPPHTHTYIHTHTHPRLSPREVTHFHIKAEMCLISAAE